MNPDFIAAWTPRVLGLLRIVSAYLFIQHGTAKLFHVPHMTMFDGLSPLSLWGVAGMLELAGGALLLVGWLTRPTAFILSGEMAVAYFVEHARLSNVLVPMLNYGEQAVLYCFIFLLISVAGPGAWSVDKARARSLT
jgi:putative oxidoreductase